MCRFAQAVCKLALEVSKLMKTLEIKFGQNHKVVEEWHEFFEDSIFPIPFGLFVDFAPEANNAAEESFLCSLGKIQTLRD